MHILKPIEINSVKIPSRVFFAPVNPGYSINGSFSDDFVKFYNEHSGKRIGVCYIGNVVLDIRHVSNENTVVFNENSDLKWIRLNDVIKNNGSVPGIQVAWKQGDMSLQTCFTTAEIDKRFIEFKKFYDTFSEYDKMSDMFVKSIIHAIEVGFPVIQIHAAHGYALSTLLSRSVSACDAPEETKGFRLLQVIMDKIKQYMNGVVFDIRVSLYEGFNDGIEEYQYKAKLFEYLQQLGFNLISLSNGFYNIDKTMIYPPKNLNSVLLSDAEKLADKYRNVVWNVTGNMEFALIKQREFPENLTFGLGRQLIRDPNTLNKLVQGKIDEIEYCNECNNCHYYSFGFSGIQKCNEGVRG